MTEAAPAIDPKSVIFEPRVIQDLAGRTIIQRVLHSPAPPDWCEFVIPIVVTRERQGIKGQQQHELKIPSATTAAQAFAAMDGIIAVEGPKLEAALDATIDKANHDARHKIVTPGMAPGNLGPIPRPTRSKLLENLKA